MLKTATIISTENSGNSLLYQLHVPAELIFFQGHFDEIALLPGVVQVQWACQLAEPLTGSSNSKDIKKLKFTKPIYPDSTVNLELQQREQSVYFRYYHEQNTYSEGTIYYE